MPRKIVFATNNRHKLDEVSRILGGKFDLLTPQDCGITDEIPENQTTLKGNASQKAHYIYNRTGLDCFADDTGLEVDALGGEPGVYSARYAGESKDSNANIDLLLKRMNKTVDRKARFKTVISLIISGKEHLFEGAVEGVITGTKSGTQGFGYDPVFRPDGYDITFAEMDSDTKNEISHRGRAVKKLAGFLDTI